MTKYERKMEAILEAEGREMRRVINFQSAMNLKQKEVAARQEQHDRQLAERRSKRREYENKRQENIQAFMERNLLCVILAGIVCILDVCKLMDFSLTFSLICIIGVYLSVNFCAYATRNQQIKGSKEKVADEDVFVPDPFENAFAYMDATQVVGSLSLNVEEV